MGLSDDVKRVAALPHNFVRVISHLDADGLCSAAIVATALKRKGVGFHLSILKQLDSSGMRKIADEPYDDYILLDFGSAKVDEIEATGKRFIVLDHHQPKRESENQVNPHFHNINGSTEISAAGLAYMFAKEIDQGNADLIHLAIVGAIGDRQENAGFSGANSELLSEAVGSGKVTVKKGLRAFGRISRPVHRALQYSTDPFIPGVSGSESGAIQFLSEIGVSPMENGSWRTMSDLTDDEFKKLVSAVVIRRSGLSKPGDVLGNIYVIGGEQGLLSDAQEFATALNALGRSNRPSLAMGLIFGDREKVIGSMEEIMTEYKKKIVETIDRVKSGELTKETDDVLYIMGGEDIDDNIIGTVTSIFAMNRELSGKSVVVGTARRGDGFKVSCRSELLNVGEIVSKVAQEVGGEGGGHSSAAGAQLPPGAIDSFITLFDSEVKRLKNT